MKIQTNEHFLREYLKEGFDDVWSRFQASGLAKTENPGDVEFHWVVRDSEASTPKSWSQTLKANKKSYLTVGFSSGYLRLSLLIRQEKGKNWECDSGFSKMGVLPHEIFRCFGASKSKWTGPVVDIFTPLHQWHPGVSEHAVLGAMISDDYSFYLLSDRSDPLNVPMWNVFSLCPVRKTAAPMLTVFDKFAQKAFSMAKGTSEKVLWCDEPFSCIGGEDAIGMLNGVKSFSWVSEHGIDTTAAPFGTMRFPLGAGLSESEKKLIPASDFLAMLSGVR